MRLFSDSTHRLTAISNRDKVTKVRNKLITSVNFRWNSILMCSILLYDRSIGNGLM